MKVLLLPMFILIFLFSCQSPAKQGMVTGAGASAGISNDSIVSLVQQAYIFGYPLVLMDATKKVSTNVPAPIPNKAIAPVNQFGHFGTFPDANFKDVVRPNCDTYYSLAWLDLSTEPLVLTVPNTNGRYYLLPMLDAYTNVFASPGKRTTGTEAGNFLLTGPGFSGTVPAGMTEIKAPTNLVWILGRTQTNSQKDGATVVKSIQDGYRLTPQSKWGSSFVPAINKVDTSVAKIPPPQALEQMDIEAFINRLNELMSANPPATQDSALTAKLSSVGVGTGNKFSLSAFDATTQEKLKAIPSAVLQQLKVAAGNLGQLENGWNVTRSGLGTYGTNYKLRALIALVGLGANLNIDASYPNCLIDNNGEKLNGSRKYVIHFNKGETPPVNACWSVTMYGPNDLLVANPINRFAIGDRDKLKYNKDGSLDIYIQRENPGKDKESNWLPADKDAFSLTMRLYWPKQQFLDGSWKVPPVTQVK